MYEYFYRPPTTVKTAIGHARICPASGLWSAVCTCPKTGCISMESTFHTMHPIKPRA